MKKKKEVEARKVNNFRISAQFLEYRCHQWIQANLCPLPSPPPRIEVKRFGFDSSRRSVTPFRREIPTRFGASKETLTRAQLEPLFARSAFPASRGSALPMPNSARSTYHFRLSCPRSNCAPRNVASREPFHTAHYFLLRQCQLLLSTNPNSFFWMHEECKYIL